MKKKKNDMMLSMKKIEELFCLIISYFRADCNQDGISAAHYRSRIGFANPQARIDAFQK